MSARAGMEGPRARALRFLLLPLLFLLLLPERSAAQEGRQKHRMRVEADGATTLVSAIQAAAQRRSNADKPVFTVSSFSTDSGIVRVFEEHMRTDTVQRSSSWWYPSVGGFTVVSRPLVVDERGMITTWRRITFEPAAEPDAFDVLFEQWEPTTNGSAEADEDERDTFYRDLKESLKQMNRRIGGRKADADAMDRAALAAAAGAGPAGEYELVSVNDQPLPYPTRVGSVSDGRFILLPDGTFRSAITTSVGIDEMKGKYALNNAVVRLTHGGGLAVARLDGDKLTYTRMGARYLFVRKGGAE